MAKSTSIFNKFFHSLGENKLARILSYLFGPEFWLPILLLAALFTTGLTTHQILILLPSLLVFQVLIPLAILHYFIKAKIIHNWDLTYRQDRNKLILPILSFWLIGLGIVFEFGNLKLFDLFIIAYVLAASLAAITHFWKISLHASMVTFGSIMLNYLFLGIFPELYLLIPVVLWSRYRLKLHTIPQLLLGCLVTATISIGGLLVFGLINL